MTTDRSRLLDLNVLIALTWPQHVHHGRVHEWFRSLQSSWATSPLTEAGFLRLSTNSKVVGRAVTFAEALEILRRLRALPGHRFLEDGSTLAQSHIDLSRAVSTGQVTDLHLVNLAANAGAVLATLDKAVMTYLAPQDRKYVELLG